MTDVTVLGATGTTGHLVVKGLTARGHRVRGVSRTSPDRFDWDARETWEPAISGSQAVYIIADERPGGVDRLGQFLEVCTTGPVERVVLLSARDWIDSDLPDGKYREDAVRGSGLGWTIIRPAWFAQDFHTTECFVEGIRRGRLVYASGDGATPFVHAADIADVAIAALTDARHDRHHYELSGPSSLTLPDAARIIGTALGRRIALEPVSSEDYQQYLISLGYDTDGIHAMQFFSDVMQRGELDYLSSGVEEALGRPSKGFEDYAISNVKNPLWAARQ